jgi:serine protease
VSLGGVVLAGLAGVVGVVLLASPAGAHNADLHGVAACDTETGTYTVTYSGTADYLQLDPVVTVTSSSPDGAGVTVSPMSPPVASNGDYTITQTGIPASTTIASLKVHVYWTDSFTRDPEAEVALPEGCSPPATPVTPGTPTFVDDTCSTDDTATYTIPDTKGVDYLVDNAKVDAGTHQATDASTVTITAVAQGGYTLTGTSTWTHTYPAAPTDCSGPAAPSFTDDVCAVTGAAGASYTIPDTAGVDYLVDDTKVAPGTHEATDGTTITITAVAQDGHQLNGTTSWTHTFPAAPTDCGTSGEAPAPTFTDATCDSPAASYTIPSSENVSYQVNDVPAAAGKHTATAGTTISIVAVAKPGFTIVGTKSWTHSFPATTTLCVAGGGTGPVSGGPVAGPPAPVAAPVLANTGLDVPAGKATIVGMLLALFGGVCLWAGRRPTAPGRHAVAKV